MKFVFATDDNYWLQTFVAIYSLVSNNRDYELEFYILCKNSNTTFNNNIDKLKLLNEQVKIKFVFVKDALEKLENFKVRQHLTLGTYYRFFIQELLPETADKVIYLDSDIIVNGSLHNLYNINLKDNLLAAVPEVEGNGPRRLGLPANSKYFNAGVLVLNLKKWRDDDVSAKLMKYSKENRHIIQWPSQDPLNAIACSQWKELPVEYNFYHGFIENKDTTYDYIEPIIIHYSGLVKPWNYKGLHPYKKLYWHYLRQTPYKFYVPHDFIVFNILSSLIPTNLKRNFKRLIKMN